MSHLSGRCATIAAVEISHYGINGIHSIPCGVAFLLCVMCGKKLEIGFRLLSRMTEYILFANLRD